jgi:hypothetical protein
LLRLSPDQEHQAVRSRPAHTAGPSLAKFVVTTLAAISGAGVAIVLRSAVPFVSTETAIATVIAGMVMLATMGVAMRILSQEAL